LFVVAALVTLDSPVSALRRANRNDVAGLKRLGVVTVRDLLLYFPRSWAAFGPPARIDDLRPESNATVVARVVEVKARRSRIQQLPLTEAEVVDESGKAMTVTWFHQPYMAKQIRPGYRLALAGKVHFDTYRHRLGMNNPEHEVLPGGAEPSRVGGLMAKYDLTGGLSDKRVALLVRDALPLADRLVDTVPPPTRERQGMPSLADTVRRGHLPETEEEGRAAQNRMTFAANLELQAAFLLARRRLADERATAVPYRQDVIDAFKAGLVFELTRAQRRAIWEVFKDMQQGKPMNRLLNGDVGSGKTAVAAAAAAMAHAAGLQTVVMAPTEILARQHLVKLRGYLEASFPGLTVELLVSGLPAAERRRVRMAAASGHCALLVGTHALIEDDVELASLGLAVVDEQHRFGTHQRELLRDKSHAGRPHFLTMTATPIPRTLAMALYGELGQSVIDEMPVGRTPVETRVVLPDHREQDAYSLVRREVSAGRQAYVVCPLIEKSEKVAARAATEEFERLRAEVFPELRLGLVHGRLSQKDEVMAAFRARQLDLLVATSVIEVGVDVANATVMLVEGADRFGLAQLHQLRGRVGRGALQAYCLLVADDPSKDAVERLHLLATTTNGFELAAKDLELRGAGEMLGVRQHGEEDAVMRGLVIPGLIDLAREEAKSLASDDPDQTRWPALWHAAQIRLDRTSVS
jgi:ATP-dependent DNA helicase RecG